MYTIRDDWDTPAVECCEVVFEYHEGYGACPLCGELFDWEDVCERWNEWDYLDEEEDGYDLEDPFMVGDDGQLDFMASLKAKDNLDVYIPLPFEGGYWKEPLANPPTQHLSRGNRSTRLVKRFDPLLDVEMPDDLI